MYVHIARIYIPLFPKKNETLALGGGNILTKVTNSWELEQGYNFPESPNEELSL